MPRGSARETYYKRKIRRLQKEISQIDAIMYDVPGDPFDRCSMLEHKRDDVVRGGILQVHTAIEDLLDLWLKSYLLGVQAEMRNKAARSRRMTARAIDDLLTGGNSIGFDRKLKLLLALRLLRQPTCKKLNELNRLRNKCSHNWLLKVRLRKRLKPHVLKPPLLQFKNRDLHTPAALQDFCAEYGRLYTWLFVRVYELG
jgi:hypothetical protein